MTARFDPRAREDRRAGPGPMALEHLAADTDPARRITIAIALARAGHPQSLAAAHALVADPLATVRVLAQIALARAGDTDTDLLSHRICVEADIGVLGFLAARAGYLPVDERAVTNLAAQAAYAATPPEIRAGCAWAVAERDAPRGGYLAGRLLADEEAAFWLASVVARRGGRLVPVVEGLRACRELDRVSAALER